MKGFGSIGITIGVVLLLVVGGGAYYLGKNQNSPKEAPSQTDSVSQTPTQALSSSNPTIDPIANWKTYKNSNLKFQISYPENSEYQKSYPGRIQLTEYPGDINQPSLLGSTNIDLILGKNGELSSLWIFVWKNLGVQVTDIASRDEWCKKLQPELQGQQECFYQSPIDETEFNNLKAFKASGGRDNSFVTTYYLPYGDYIYEISASKPMQDLDNPLPGKVLSTFKFIN